MTHETTLTEAERMALDNFLGMNWAEFCDSAEAFLCDQEIDDLAEKLGNSK